MNSPVVRLLLAASSLATASFASGEGSAISSFPLHGTLDTSVRSDFVSYRTSRALNHRPVLQNDLIINLPDDYWLNVWTNNTLTGSAVEKASNETDFAVGQKHHVDEYTVDTSIRLMNVSPMGTVLKGDFFDVALFATGKEIALTADQSIRQALDVEWLADAHNIGNSWPLVQPGVIHTWKRFLGIDRLTLVDKDWLAWDDGFRKSSPKGLFFRADVCLSIAVSKRLTVTPVGIRQLVMLINPHDGRKTTTQTWTGIKATF